MQCSLAAGSHLLPPVRNRLAHLSYGKRSDNNAVISAVTLVSPVSEYMTGCIQGLYQFIRTVQVS